MVDRVKSLNWNLYTKFFVLLGYMTVIFAIIQLALNTKSLENSSIIIYYIIIGFTTITLMKMSDATISEIKE